MDLLQLGLDVSTWDNTKKKTLEEYITLFDRLAQYDQKVINPIMGTGLVEFNNSMKQTSSLLAEINSGLAKLDSSKSYVASVSNATKDLSNSTKASNTELQKTTEIQNRINASLGIGQKSAQGYREEQARVTDTLRVLNSEKIKEIER